jgi:hypothetical protein
MRRAIIGVGLFVGYCYALALALSAFQIANPEILFIGIFISYLAAIELIDVSSPNFPFMPILNVIATIGTIIFSAIISLHFLQLLST